MKTLILLMMVGFSGFVGGFVGYSIGGEWDLLWAGCTGSFVTLLVAAWLGYMIQS